MRRNSRAGDSTPKVDYMELAVEETTKEEEEEDLVEQSPAPESPLIDGATHEVPRDYNTLKSSVFGLSSTIIGGGALSLPRALADCGLVTGLICLVVVMVASDYSIYLLISAARHTKGQSLEEVGEKTFGWPMKLLIMLVTVIVCFIVCIAYLMLICDLMEPTLLTFLRWSSPQVFGWLTREWWMVISAFLLYPLSLPRALRSLRFASIFAVGSILFLAVAVACRSIQRRAGGDPNRFGDVGNDLNLFGSLHGVLYGLPVFAVSFLCHFSVLPTHTEMKRPTRKRVKRMIHMTIGLCGTLYIIIGVFGYLHFLDKTKGLVLKNYPGKDYLISIGQIGLCGTLYLSFPLLVLPCRTALERLYLPCFGRTKPGVALHLIETALIVFLALLFALKINGVLTVWNAMGSIICIPLEYILPPVLYLKAKAKGCFTRHTFPALCLLISGIIVMCITVYETVYALLQHKGKDPTK